MDIDLLSKMVKELILDNDRVVLPGLGAFVAETMPSTFSDKGFTINPPYRRLSFRSKPDEGDLLAAFYASENGIDLRVADKVIRDFVSELKSVLYIRKTIIFPGLGRMRATKENTVFFVADENLDIYPDGVGLDAISLKTHQESIEEVEAAVVELKAIVDPQPEFVATQPDDLQPVQSEAISPQPIAPQPQPIAQQPQPDALDSQIEVLQPADPQPADLQQETIRQEKKALKTVLWIILALVVALALFVAVSRLQPQLLDGILYTPEELEILQLR